MPRAGLARILTFAGALSVGLIVSADTYKVPRTPWGDPDLQGLWPGNMGVPMQRPEEFGERAELTEAEFSRRQSQAAVQAKADAEAYVRPSDGPGGIGGPSHWVERGRPTRQASLVGESLQLKRLTLRAEEVVHGERRVLHHRREADTE